MCVVIIAGNEKEAQFVTAETNVKLLDERCPVTVSDENSVTICTDYTVNSVGTLNKSSDFVVRPN